MATVTLRPNGAGFVDDWTPIGDSPSWKCVDEVIADDFTTCIQNDADTNGINILFTIDSNSIGVDDTINSITIYYRSNSLSSKFGGNGCIPTYRENSVTSEGTSNSSVDVWTTYSQTFTVKGSNGLAFTKSDIDSLQIGVAANQVGPGITYCTQLYVVVDYTPSGGGSPVVKPVIMMLETDD